MSANKRSRDRVGLVAKNQAEASWTKRNRSRNQQRKRRGQYIYESIHKSAQTAFVLSISKGHPLGLDKATHRAERELELELATATTATAKATLITLVINITYLRCFYLALKTLWLCDWIIGMYIHKCMTEAPASITFKSSCLKPNKVSGLVGGGGERSTTCDLCHWFN